MKKTVQFFKGGLLVFCGSMMLSSCFLAGGGGGGAPTSVQPGALSTATGLAYNDDDNNGFMVNPYQRSARWSKFGIYRRRSNGLRIF